MSKARNYLIAAASVLATSALLVTPTTAQTVNLVERSGAWSIYADTGTPKKVCFAASSPQAVEPIGANRGSIFFYISAWPKDGVKAEPSVKLGYPVNTEKGVTVTIGTDVFKLFSKEQHGFVADPSEELKLIDALKKGSTAMVRATSTRGTSTTDTYSLSGISKALEKLTATCP
ncbi:MAG: invasion associated locus B family protein [Hyphomicrobium sp.]|jgi:invasion protein IalB